MNDGFEYWKSSLLKVVGILLLAYWSYKVGETLCIKWIPALFFLYFCINISFMYLFSFFKKEKFLNKEVESRHRKFANFFKKNPWVILLAPGEDGLFFLPVVASGFRIEVAIVCALVFGLLHFRSRSLWNCFALSITSWCIMYLLIPKSGILAWSAAHFLIDLVIVLILILFEPDRSI